MGLLSYIVEGFEPGDRDVVFLPVGLGYDRVLEDRVLVKAASSGGRRFPNRPVWVAWNALRFLVMRLIGRTKDFGTAAVGFDGPISLRGFLADGGTVEGLGERLMAAIREVVPVLPVPLVARAIGDGVASRAELAERLAGLIARLQGAGVGLELPEGGLSAVLREGLEPLIRRGLVSESLQPLEQERALLAFYADSVSDPAAATRQKENFKNG
jgi:glycerol-3-phosphate O-acyltransferase